MKPEEIVQKLASFKHRGTATEAEPLVLEFLSSLFPEKQVKKQAFRTPKTYISVVWLLIGGLSLGLLFLLSFPFVGVVLTFLFVTMALLYFNWYASPVTSFPPQVTSHNLVIKKPSEPQNSKKKVILMAHWDTAPISLLYTPQMVGNFRQSLKMSLILMVLAETVAIIHFFFENQITYWLAIGLAVYFIIQGITATIDFFRLGYSNGASDNATGVAAAIETANQIWEFKNNEIDVELVITGAEEVGMIGARAYFLANQKNFTKDDILINFDTLGNGDLKVITQTGSWSNIVYENDLVKKMKQIISSKPEFSNLTTGAWHTADFDSVWFQRAGIPSVTLSALDKNGRMPNIHRPTDTLENVDFKPMNDAIKLAVETVNSFQ